MKKKFKILQLEYLQADVELIQKELANSIVSFESIVVNNKTDFNQTLKEFLPDIILAEYSPNFTLAEALKIAKESSIKKIPFILVTGRTEEFAVNLITEEIDDYILKGRLRRLPKAILNTLSKYELLESQEFFKRPNNSDAEYLAFFNTSSDAMLLSIKNGKILSPNPAACAMFGYSKEEFTQLEESSIIDIGNPKYIAFLKERNHKGSAKGEFLLIKKDGTKFECEMVSVTFSNDKKEERNTVIIRDLTKQKQSENILRESETKYRSFFESNIDAMMLTMANGKVLSANPAACAMLGRTEDEIRSADKFEILDAKDSNLKSLVDQRKQTGIARGELTLLRKDGTSFPAEHSSVVFKDANGDDKTSVIFRDITERKQAEKEIAKSQQQYATLINTIDGIVWQANAETFQFSFVSKFAETLLGYPVQQWIEEHDFWKNHLHPDDREQAIQYCLKCTIEKRSHEFDYRMIAANGKEIWLHDKVSVIIENNQPVYLRGIMTDISERKRQQLLIEKSNKDHKQSEQHLKNVSAELEKVMNYSLDVICSIDKEGRFIRVSAASSDVWGYSPEELITEFYIDHVDPDYVEITKRSLSNIMSGVTTTNFENRYIHKNGNSVPLTWSARWDKNEEIIFCVARDASALKEAERLEAESEQRWKTIFNRANDAILLNNNSGKFTEANPAAANILGYTINELLELSVTDIIAGSVTDEGSNLFIGILKEEQQNGVIELKRKDGEIISCHYNAVTNILPGLHLSILTDITERQKSIREIDQLNIILEKRAEELSASNKELESFAYVTSHDLQEPLRMVTSFLQLLQQKYDDQLDETAQKYISYAVDGAIRMKTLILDLLEYSRVNMHREVHSVIDLNEVLAKTLDTLKSVKEQSQASIIFPYLPEVHGNKSQLLQLFQNLISNALKYRSSSKPVIELSYHENKDEWQFLVKDNGIGIDPKFFEKIFIIFQRLHNRNEFEGTGIGLSISKKIVELHGGKIWVESLPGEGSKFYFTIPKFAGLNNLIPKRAELDIIEIN